MAEYLASQTREIVVTADSAAEARKIAEAVFYARPGFDKNLRRGMHHTPVNIEKRRE